MYVLGYHSVTEMIEGESLAAISDSSMNALLVGLALVIALVLFSLCQYHHNTTLSLTSGTAHSLNQSDWALGGIKTDNEVNVSNVQSLLSHTRGH